MLAGLNALDLGRLRMSVGYGTHKKGRPLSPVEVGILLRKARGMGASLQDCAIAMQLRGTGHIGRFLRILELPEELQHLISWGGKEGKIGFSIAVELAKIQDVADQRVVAQSILTDRLNSRDVRQIAQLRERSGKSIRDCVQEILGMRPKIVKSHVFIGSIVDNKVQQVLSSLTQKERDAILKSGIKSLNLQVTSGRLGQRMLTLIGDENLGASIHDIGKENLEEQFRAHIMEATKNVKARG